MSKLFFNKFLTLQHLPQPSSGVVSTPDIFLLAHIMEGIRITTCITRFGMLWSQIKKHQLLYWVHKGCSHTLPMPECSYLLSVFTACNLIIVKGHSGTPSEPSWQPTRLLWTHSFQKSTYISSYKTMRHTHRALLIFLGQFAQMPFKLYGFLLVTVPEFIVRRQHLRIQSFQRFIKQPGKKSPQN